MFKKTVRIWKQTIQEWQEDQAPRFSAALAFYSTFSIAPLLIIIIGIAGIIFGKDAAQGRLMGELGNLVGDQAAGALQEAIKSASVGGRGVWATVIGALTLLIGATSVFGEMQTDLNTMWNVKPKPGKAGLWGFLRSRIFSFGLIIAIGFLLLVSLTVSASLTAFSNFLGQYIPGQELLLQIANIVVGLVVVTVLFALIYKYLPDAKIKWRDVWPGAFLTAILFTVGRVLIGLYIGHSAVGSSFGAAGSLVILLLWVYYSAQILFLGAEYTQVRASIKGAGVKPASYAETKKAA
jgi:membrane protein